jgi:hypothetical protein
VHSAAELVTLAGGGLGLWLAITGAAPADPLPRPLRAAIAAVAMWAIWVVAYVTGMSALGLAAGRGAATVSAAADRQLTAAVLWAVPAVCFGPAVYRNVLAWLGERDSQRQQPGSTAGSATAAGGSLSPRPPRGWRTTRR